jgi:hypothetical protein
LITEGNRFDKNASCVYAGSELLLKAPVLAMAFGVAHNGASGGLAQGRVWNEGIFVLAGVGDLLDHGHRLSVDLTLSVDEGHLLYWTFIFRSLSLHFQIESRVNYHLKLSLLLNLTLIIALVHPRHIFAHSSF